MFTTPVSQYVDVVLFFHKGLNASHRHVPILLEVAAPTALSCHTDCPLQAYSQYIMVPVSISPAIDCLSAGVTAPLILSLCVAL